MAVSTYFAYIGGPKNTGTPYGAVPDYDGLGYIMFDGFYHHSISRTVYNGGIYFDYFEDTVKPPSGAVLIVRILYYQDDVSYGSNEFSELTGRSIPIYMPVTSTTSNLEPYVSVAAGGSVRDTMSVNLSAQEKTALKSTYANPLNETSTQALNTYFQSFTTEMYTTLISRDNVPNVIRTNQRKDNLLNALADETATNPSNIAISTTSTAVSTY